MSKIGVIGVPGSWSSEHLTDEVERQTGQRFLIDMAKVRFDLDRNQIFYGNEDLQSFDAFIIKKIGERYSPDLLNRLEILNYLSDKGVRFFSEPKKICGLLDRMSCTLKLKQAGISIPPTVITEDLDEALAATEDFGKAVLKPLYTSKARGMVVVDSSNGAKSQIESFKAAGNEMIYIQKLVPIPGKDLGIVFLGNKYLATYARVAKKDSWNTTTNSGGKYQPYEPDEAVIKLAHKAQEIFGLDFTCVDLVETPSGPKVFEVSAFGGFKGLKDAHDIDAAKLIVDFVLKRLSE